MFRRLAVLAFLCLIAVTYGFTPKANGSIDLAFGIPQNEFKDNLDRIGFGLSGHLAYLPNQNLGIGGALGFMSYGSEKRKEPFSTTIPDVTVDVTTSHNFMFGHVMVQPMLNLGIVKPYIEGRFGFNYLWTDTKIENEDSDDEPIASSTNFEDFTISYGGGAGLMILVWDNTSKSSRNTNNNSDAGRIYIDLKGLYLLGGEAEYLKEGSIHSDGGTEVLYDVSKSTTDLLTINIGVAFEF